MTEDKYRYDAFISYRHVEPDRKWAMWLHKALETFRTPKPLVAKGIAPRIKRVFRDEDELPASADLSKEIDSALEQSRFLIVVCSPRTPESEWVNQEVVRFREMGRHDKILALLIEGEPAESFPRSLREIRTTITDESGEVTEHIEDVEPLAADVREGRDESAGFLKRMALLRFSAALLGCRFDDLRRREAERRKQRLVVGASALLFVAVALAGLAIFAFSEQTRAERQQARAESEWARAESERNAKTTALKEKTDALDRVLRLADSKKVRDLLDEIGATWPLHPDRAGAMATWIKRAMKLLENRPDHEKTLAELREKARPYTEEQRLNDHAVQITRMGKLHADVVNKKSERAMLADDETEASKKKYDALTKAIERAKEEIRHLDSVVKQQVSWQFDSDEDAWRHQVLSGLLDGLARIESDDGEGTLAEVRERLDFVSNLHKQSIEAHRAKWDEVIAGIADSYAGLQIKPQLGLVPLGPDPESGLYEFAHVGSGSIPTRDQATKHLVQAKDAAIVLVLIPGGSFLMGSQRKDEQGANYDPKADDDESDQNQEAVRVTLSPFLLSKYECTQAQWAAMTGGLAPSRFRAGVIYEGQRITLRNPVEQVSWADVASDPGWLVRNRLVLPSEAQWEYACRAGTDTPWITGREVARLGTVANVSDAHMKAHGGANMIVTPEVDDGHSVHASVGSFAANAFGLFDMHGNVWEWCQDWFDMGYYGVLALGSAADRTDPLGPEGRDFRVFRGGSWSSPAGFARSALRYRGAPAYRVNNVGFRPARSIEK